ncbi:MAG: hypothetical protein ACRD4R_05670 [Candidatus Acidiferrales bacterium]
MLNSHAMPPPKCRDKKPAASLSPDQVELAAQFADYAFDYPHLTFDEAARKVLPRGVR